MRSKLLGFLGMIAAVLAVVIVAVAQDAPPNRITHNGQDLFLSGINLAWINFAHDTSNFDEPRFVEALDAIAKAKGNTLRWWLHTNGSASPIYDEDGKVIALGPNDIKSMQRALDLAYERGILIMMCLWSHDMMNDVNGVPTDANKLMIEDPEYTRAYIDNALIPLVTALKGHPGIVAWEVFNEPEGTTDQFGWTDQRTTMESIQQFVNLIAGAIHRADPEAKVTNGSWNFRVLTDVGGFTNYYTDERLIAAGGDEDGTLDFYTVHYYPEWFDETTSPFHHPASYWELDKPIVVAEFPAAGLRDLGTGYLPRKQIPYSIQTYPNLFNNGYAGAVSWAYTGGQQFGDLLDASSGMLRIANALDAEAVTVDIGDVDRIPVVLKQIGNVVVPNDTTALPDAVTLSEIFSDAEDGADMTYVISNNSRSDVVEAVIEDGVISLNFTGKIGSAVVEVSATDKGEHTSSAKFVVQVVDPNVGNMALGKEIVASTVESESFAPGNAVDGLLDTRSSTLYSDPQWYIIDLGGVFTVNQVILRWEAAYGNNYDIQVWDGSAWQTVYHEPLGDGEIDDITLETPVDTRFVKFNGIGRGAEWGYSLWEFEVNGIRSETPNAALETVPPEFTAALEATPEALAALESTVLYSFEEDAQGWAAVDFWTAITSAVPSEEMASDGSSSLAATGSFSGTEWQEGGVFLALPEGTDWSASDVLTIDVYAPEGASGFITQIYTKTGADSAWTNTTDMPLTAGEWNTLTADLSTLGDLTNVREVGLKIGTSATAFEGTFFIDRVAVATLAEDPAEPEMGLETTALYDFEADAQGWAVVDFWTGITSAETSAEMANEGESSLAATGTFSGTEWQEGGVFIALPEGTDWSEYNNLLIDLYVPEGASNFIAQVYTKTGADSAWMNTADMPLTAGEWNTLNADLTLLGDLTNVREVGLKVGTSATAFTGTFFIDNILLAKRVAATSTETEAEVVDPSTLTAAPLTTFEAGNDGWAVVDFWTAITSAEASTEMANEGTGSLAATGTFSGTEWQEGGVFLTLPEGTDWSSSKLLTVDVYVPEGADNFIAQVYAKTGPEWTWANTADMPLTAGQWNTLTADLSTLGNTAMMHEVGLKIGTSSTAFTGTFFIDNVQLLGE